MKPNRFKFLFLCFFIIPNIATGSVVSPEVLFDYSSALIGLSNEISQNQIELDAVADELIVLQNATGYDELVVIAIKELQDLEGSLTLIINDLQAVYNEINSLLNLDSSEKDKLYYYYSILGVGHKEFMVRMPFNYSLALADPVILDLVADSTNSSQAKIALAKLVYQNYQINSEHIGALSRLYRYLP